MRHPAGLQPDVHRCLTKLPGRQRRPWAAGGCKPCRHTAAAFALDASLRRLHRRAVAAAEAQIGGWEGLQATCHFAPPCWHPGTRTINNWRPIVTASTRSGLQTSAYKPEGTGSEAGGCTMTQAAGEPGPGADPTVATPEQLAAIQAALGVSLADTDPAVLSHIVERSRLAGNEAFRQRRYRGEGVQDGGGERCGRSSPEAEEAGLGGGMGTAARGVPEDRSLRASVSLSTH